MALIPAEGACGQGDQGPLQWGPEVAEDSQPYASLYAQKHKVVF